MAALREIEFDRATGKLSDADYAELKARYTEQAIAAMRRGTATPTSRLARPTDDEIEAAVRAYRADVCAVPDVRTAPGTRRGLLLELRTVLTRQVRRLRRTCRRA